MSEREDTNVIELLLQEPEIIAWLDDYRPVESDESREEDTAPLDAA